MVLSCRDSQSLQELFLLDPTDAKLTSKLCIRSEVDPDQKTLIACSEVFVVDLRFGG